MPLTFVVIPSVGARYVMPPTVAPAATYELTSVARASQAVAMLRMSAMVRFCFDRCMAVSRLGMAMAARMPMIATTISSSIRVKPFCLFVMNFLLILRLV
jgi:hypothetical protein